MFLLTVGEAGLSEMEFYLWLFVLLAVQIFFYKLDNPREVVLDTESYDLDNVLPQAVMGLLIGLGLSSFIMLFGTYRGLPSPSYALFQVFFVANVETLWMICFVTMLGTGNAAVYLWPVIFGIAHPVVRLNWFAGQFPLESFVGFAYAALMGAFFYLLWMGHRYVSETWKPFFGSVTPWATHAILNLIVTVFLFSLWGLTLVPI